MGFENILKVVFPVEFSSGYRFAGRYSPFCICDMPLLRSLIYFAFGSTKMPALRAFAVNALAAFLYSSFCLVFSRH